MRGVRRTTIRSTPVGRLRPTDTRGRLRCTNHDLTDPIIGGDSTGRGRGTDPDDRRKPVEMLNDEGIRFINDRADDSKRLASDELTTLIERSPR